MFTGLYHISFRKFIDRKAMLRETVDEVFSNVSRNKQKYQKDKEKIKDLSKSNIKLSNEIMRLSKIATEIAKKDYHQRMI